MRAGFARFWAHVSIVFGMVLVGIGLLLAGMVFFLDLPWGTVGGPAPIPEDTPGWVVVSIRALGAAFLVVSGFIAGAPFIIGGQLLLVFLEQVRVTARIGRRLRRWERTYAAALPRESRHTDRLRAQ